MEKSTARIIQTRIISEIPRSVRTSEPDRFGLPFDTSGPSILETGFFVVLSPFFPVIPDHHPPNQNPIELPKTGENKRGATTHPAHAAEKGEITSRKINGITKIDLVWEKLTAVLNLSATMCRY